MGQRDRDRTRCGSAYVLVSFVVSTCGGPPPADPRHVAVEERRLLQPYLEGKIQQLGCDELTITITPNFADNVSQPAVDVRSHLANKKNHGDYHETEWVNVSGDPKSAFTVTVANNDLDAEIASGKRNERRGVTFTVLRTYRLRVLNGRHPLALEADSKGGLVTVEGGQPRDLREFKIADGVLHAR